MTKPDNGFTQRTLMALVEEVRDLNQATHRVSTLIEALAKEHDVPLPGDIRVADASA